MPRRHAWIVLIASSLVALLGLGCQTPPELATYREGLHAVDEPLYRAHLLLMDDAVAAKLRTDADRQVIQQGIAAARGLYQQSVATQAAGASPIAGSSPPPGALPAAAPSPIAGPAANADPSPAAGPAANADPSPAADAHAN